MRIVFMGTPEFAVPSLKILVENGFNIVAVITATDKYGGRGGKVLLESPVKKYAVSQNIDVLQPKNLKADDFVEELRSYNADLQFVVAFRMLPEVVWNMPDKGTFNLHGSLLPKYRGAAPINWAVINGEKETGVTTFKLRHEIDTGSILLQEKLAISPSDTAGDVHDKMMIMGAEVVLETVKKIESEDYQLIPQDDTAVTKAPKIFTETCKIHWNQSQGKVYNFIRGLSPFPTAWSLLDGKKFKIFEAELAHKDQNTGNPGQIVVIGKEMLVNTLDGVLAIKKVQLAGKKKMPVGDFLNGYQIKVAQLL